MAESNIGLRLCGRCSHVLTDRSAACDYTETRTEQNEFDFLVTASSSSSSSSLIIADVLFELLLRAAEVAIFIIVGGGASE